ncbi:MAG: hypothetical protein H9789_00100 [Candidatus Paraprevotella stercoravium]|uniref:Uncharacterized protein n=1 Tax=Candidatus Paraprevotella stercoravium TaxID=2838725 RepID=A0A9E2P1H5_9BACT|nr:hypothetical protein [Candidatus Paraprevotella stercoravium]
MKKEDVLMAMTRMMSKEIIGFSESDIHVLEDEKTEADMVSSYSSKGTDNRMDEIIHELQTQYEKISSYRSALLLLEFHADNSPNMEELNRLSDFVGFIEDVKLRVYENRFLKGFRVSLILWNDMLGAGLLRASIQRKKMVYTT